MGASSDEDGMRVLVVGLDAGCRPVLEPLFESGVTPTLRRVFEMGTSGPLESQIPPWTASAWPSLYTGKNPGKHGVYDFLSFDGYDWDVVNASHVRARPVWELLDEHGYSSVVVNVPVTHPPGEFEGALIPGMTAPEDPPCHPPGILEDVKLACNGYRVYPQSGDEPDRSLEAYERTIECRGRAFRYLCRRMDPDFGFVQFQQTDSVFHERPGDREAIEGVYGAVDDELERTLEAVDPETILVVSDHGIGPVSGPEFRVNQFLRERGDVAVRSGGEGMPNWTASWEADLLDGQDAGSSGGSPIQTAMQLAARVGITTQRVAGALDRIGLKDPIGRRVPNAMVRAASEQVDFPQSRVYVRSKSELGVRINLEGREPDGIVPPEEYDSVREAVIEALSGVTTPDGEPMFEAVEPRETYFDGPQLEAAPDVVTVPREFDTAISASLGEELFVEPMESWNHKPVGIVAAAGAEIDEGEPVSTSERRASIFDVAPTICSLFDVPIDAAMDGQPLPVVEETAAEEYPTYDVEPVTAIDDGVVEDRLSDLGYL